MHRKTEKKQKLVLFSGKINVLQKMSSQTRGTAAKCFIYDLVGMACPHIGEEAQRVWVQV
jgi:hypothetical protein